MKRMISLLLIGIIFIAGCSTLKVDKCCESKEVIKKQQLRVIDPNAKPIIQENK